MKIKTYKIPKEDREYLIIKLRSLISCCCGCESCDLDQGYIKRLRSNQGFNNQELTSLACRMSVTHQHEEVVNIKRNWRKGESVPVTLFSGNSYLSIGLVM